MSHYTGTTERSKEYTRQARAKTRKWIAEYKEGRGCCICGEAHPRCLDFHHVGEEKKDTNISRLISTGRLGVIKEEIKKCIIVCANCHRKIHA